MRNISLIILYFFLISGMVGGNLFLYSIYIKKDYDNFLRKNKIICINIDKIIDDKKKELIKKYKKQLISKLKNKDILMLEPDSILDKDTIQKIKKDLDSFNAQLNDVIKQFKEKGYIVLKSNSVLSGSVDITNDLEKILIGTGGNNE